MLRQGGRSQVRQQFSGGQGLSGSERRIIQIIPCSTEQLAVFANENGQPFSQTVPAFALVEDWNGTSVIPLTSDARELTLADESENYLGLVEGEEDVQNFTHEAQAYAKQARRFGGMGISRSAQLSGQGMNSSKQSRVQPYEGGVHAPVRQQINQQRPEVS